MSKQPTTPAFPFAIGCPVWSCDQWGDVVYPARTPRREWLSHYTRMFNTVEGNSTFYALPSIETAQRWADEAAEGFEFALKFPRDISHEGELRASSLLDQFLEIVSVLATGKHAGPSFLQLPPWYDASRLDELVSFLHLLPSHLPWSVEVRHESWFKEEAAEAQLHEAFVLLGIDRVIFDSRALFQSPADDPIEAESQKRKPKSPVRFIRTGKRPMIRIVGRNRIELADRFVEEWLPILHQWVTDGCRPYVFTHAPDDAYAPAFARRMAEAYRVRYAPASDPLPTPPVPPKQLTLFGD
jgi:uncharacterized protein YecE (DUF72 family)